MNASAPFKENNEPSTIFKVGGLKRGQIQFFLIEKNLTKYGRGIKSRVAWQIWK